jgi:ABC-2 type transport system ATP-binding protein
MWGVIKELVQDGTTLLLTTQYLEEADHLANEIAVIDTGKVIARGTADELKRRIGGEHLEIVVEARDLVRSKSIIEEIVNGKAEVDESLNSISAPVSTGTAALVEVINSLSAVGINPLDIALKRPSLDDVFLALTGHKAEESK